jgi:hypothetical protein
MTAFVEECRREWKRLGVPDGLAEEMATDLESDLAEAEADGVSAAEMLGESDPRRFAASWASERGLVTDEPPRKRRKRFWIGLAFALLVLVVLGIAVPLFLATATSVQSGASGPVRVETPTRVHVVRVPNLVGLKACMAEGAARDAGLSVRHVPQDRCNALVIGQRPAAGNGVRRHGTLTLRLRLQG